MACCECVCERESCEYPAGSTDGICPVVTNLPLKPDQLFLNLQIDREIMEDVLSFFKKRVRIKLAEVDKVNIGENHYRFQLCENLCFFLTGT